MKLLTPDVGWAATNHKLFWTTDSGAQWKDITPKLGHKWQAVSSVFFLDPTTGWVLLNCADRNDRKADDTCFELASATSAGESWSVVHPKVVDPDPEAGFSGQTHLGFADQSHGWMILQVSRSTAVSFGVMLRTEDGGKTWSQLPQPPIAEPFRFVTAQDGWLAGGPDDELYVTRDAGRSWRLVTVARPGDLGPDRGVTYDLPVFQDEHRGFLPVRYEVGPELGPITSTLVLFSTDDGGRTWREDSTLPGLPDNYGPGIPYPSAVIGSVLTTAMVGDDQMTLRRASRGAKAGSQSAHISVHPATIEELSLVSPERGLVLATYWMLSTSDGGNSWSNITPDRARTVPASALLAALPARRLRRAA